MGTKVQKGEILGKIHANDTTKLEIAKKQVNDIIKISPEYCKKNSNNYRKDIVIIWYFSKKILNLEK